MNETVKPLKGKYERLYYDLINAKITTHYLETSEDGGTCNFDAPTITLPRWNENGIRKAAEDAGLRAWKWYGSTWILSFPTSGQGNRRTRRAEAIKDELAKNGYNVGMYYQMD